MHPTPLHPTPRTPLTPWELPLLLTPLHMLRQTKQKRARYRKHYAAILSFVYRNRFVVSSQVQRRFSQYLKSDRTTRRHLEELQQLRLIDIAPTRNTSPVFPKVYYVTGRGVRKLKQAYAARGKSWDASRIDRKGRHSKEGYTAEQVLHEILLTEFLLAVWQTVQARPDLELLTIQRRSLAKHPSFQVSVGNRLTQLKPDALFLYRQKDRGLMVCCVEMDMGSMNKRQLRAKFARYHAWAESDQGKQFLLELYRRHGASNPRPSFRLLVVAKDRGDHDERRVAAVLSAACSYPAVLNRIWIATVADLQKHQQDLLSLGAALWQRGNNVQSWFEKAAVNGGRKTAKKGMTQGWLREAPLFSLFDICMPV